MLALIALLLLVAAATGGVLFLTRPDRKALPPPIIQEVVSLLAVKDLLNTISKQRADTLVRLHTLQERLALLEQGNDLLLSRLRSPKPPTSSKPTKKPR